MNERERDITPRNAYVRTSVSVKVTFRGKTLLRQKNTKLFLGDPLRTEDRNVSKMPLAIPAACTEKKRGEKRKRKRNMRGSATVAAIL